MRSRLLPIDWLLRSVQPAGNSSFGIRTSPPKIWGWFPGPNDRSEKVPGVGALLPDNPIIGLPVPAAPLAGVARKYLIEPGTAPVRRRHGLVRVSRIPPARVPVRQARSDFKPALDLLQAAGLGLEEGWQFEDSESAHTVGADSRVLMTVGGWLGAAIPPDEPHNRAARLGAPVGSGGAPGHPEGCPYWLTPPAGMVYASYQGGSHLGS